MLTNTDTAKCITVIILSLLHLLVIQTIYDFRDNLNYISSYENIQNSTNMYEALRSYYGSTGASEPVYFVLQYAFVNIVSYDLFTNIINFIFLMTLYLVIGRYFTKKLLAFIIILLFDYYLYRLTGELHRFKLAILFFMLYLYFDNLKLRSISVFLSVLSHFQLIILYSFFLMKEFKYYKNIRLRILLFIPILIILIGIFGVVFQGALLSKLNYYAEFQLPISTVIIGFVYFGYLVLLNDKINTKYFIYLLLIMLPSAFIVGSDRINIFLIEFAFIVELYKILEKKKYTAFFIVVPIMSYNIFRVIDFLTYVSGI